MKSQEHLPQLQTAFPINTSTKLPTVISVYEPRNYFRIIKIYLPFWSPPPLPLLVMGLSHSCPQLPLQKTKSKPELQLTPCRDKPCCTEPRRNRHMQGGGSADSQGAAWKVFKWTTSFFAGSLPVYFSGFSHFLFDLIRGSDLVIL